MSVDQIKGNVIVNEVKRLKTTHNGERCDSMSVLLYFAEDSLPSRVYIGYMSYNVRLYIPPPRRCFKCQRYCSGSVVGKV